MQGNVDKLTKCFLKNPIKYEFVDSLILENKEDQEFSSDALLWLKRALELIHKFFENILNDVQASESLKGHLQSAYDCTLKQYHGWFVQNTVTVSYTRTLRRIAPANQFTIPVDTQVGAEQIGVARKRCLS